MTEKQKQKLCAECEFRVGKYFISKKEVKKDMKNLFKELFDERVVSADGHDDYVKMEKKWSKKYEM